MSSAEATGSEDRRIVLVVGPGRSGTSTMAGVLTKLGLEVPGKVIPPNPTNPRGFFEPRWVVNLHKRTLRTAVVSTIDGAPDAQSLVDTVVERDGVRETLLEWVRDRLVSQPRLVVKDPRLIWFTDLWAEVSRRLGIVPDFVVMLRHPAEVIGSRQTYYARGKQTPGRADNVAQLAGWINVALRTEQVTRGGRRAFVHYEALTRDWRPVMARVEQELRLGLAVPGKDEHHEIDDFIDPTLRRVQRGWDDVEVPECLRGLADRLWQLLLEMAEHGDSEERLSRADELRAEYQDLATDAAAISRRLVRRAWRDGHRRGTIQERRRARRAAAATRRARANRPGRRTARVVGRGRRLVARAFGRTRG